MKIIYTIDNGNSHPHVGIFKVAALEKVIPLKECDFELADSRAILSSVGADIKLPLKNIFNVASLRTETSFLDMPVNYSSTLGMDRLCCAYWVFKNIVKGNKKILLIDAGTFTTFDLISENGFEGGFIFPGIQTFLNTYSNGKNLLRLDLKEQELNTQIDLPHSTEKAIGEAAKLYFQTTLKQITDTFKPDEIFTTGGEGSFFSNENFIPHLIHQALFEISETQK